MLNNLMARHAPRSLPGFTDGLLTDGHAERGFSPLVVVLWTDDSISPHGPDGDLLTRPLAPLLFAAAKSSWAAPQLAPLRAPHPAPSRAPPPAP
jgi:hypothetical protein